MPEIVPPNFRDPTSPLYAIDALKEPYYDRDVKVLVGAFATGYSGIGLMLGGAFIGMVVALALGVPNDVYEKAVGIPALIGLGTCLSPLIWSPPVFIYDLIRRQLLETKKPKIDGRAS